MTNILELKDKIIKLYEEYEHYAKPVIHFLISLAVFITISTNIGYNAKISSLPISLILSLVCCLLPQNTVIFAAAVVILLDMYSLAVEVAIVTAVLFLAIYFIYFRFAPKHSMGALLTPVFFKLHIPYVMPIAGSLVRELTATISIVCGTIVYFFLDGIKTNAAAISGTLVDETATTSKLNIIIGQMTNNKEMVLTIGVMIVTSFLVYYVRRMAINQAWMIAIVVGAIVEIVGLLVGYMILGLTHRIPELLIGGIISMALAFGVRFFCMNLDYARVERVQFEDDDYYYYVKAVPKKNVKVAEKTVKHFGNTSSMGKRIEHGAAKPKSKEEEEISKKVFAQELDIDEDLLD